MNGTYQAPTVPVPKKNSSRSMARLAAIPFAVCIVFYVIRCVLSGIGTYISEHLSAIAAATYDSPFASMRGGRDQWLALSVRSGLYTFLIDLIVIIPLVILIVFLLRNRRSIAIPIVYGVLSQFYLFNSIGEWIRSAELFRTLDSSDSLAQKVYAWSNRLSGLFSLLFALLILAAAVIAGILLKKPTSSKAFENGQKIALLPSVCIAVFELLQFISAVVPYFFTEKPADDVLASMTSKYISVYVINIAFGFLTSLFLAVGIFLVNRWLVRTASKRKAVTAPQSNVPQQNAAQYNAPPVVAPQYHAPQQNVPQYNTPPVEAQPVGTPPAAAPQTPSKATRREEITEELLMYKQLLDYGIISQAEFDEKKRELLNP